MSNPILDLEQELMNCWHVVDDLGLIYKNVMDNNLNPEEVANVLLGLKHLYQMRFEACFREFEQVCKSQYEDTKTVAI